MRTKCTEDSYPVALARDHGYPAMVPYRGRSQAHAQEIAEALSEVAELPLDRG